MIRLSQLALLGAFCVTMFGREAHGQCLIPHVAKLIATDGAAGDQFSFGLAIEGDTAVIGSFHDDDTAPESGSVYILQHQEGHWQQVQKLHPLDPESNDYFGRCVAIDGDTLVIGAHFDDDAGLDSGSAYVFRRLNGQWQQISKLTASDGAPFDHFGYSVAIHMQYVVVGARDSGSQDGSAYVFEEIGGIWQQVARISQPGNIGRTEFGSSVAVQNGTIFVGAPEDASPYPGWLGGSVLVFRQTEGTWTLSQRLIPDFRHGGNDFGSALVVEGTTLVVGGQSDSFRVVQGGAAFVYEEFGGLWKPAARLEGDRTSYRDSFGAAVSISGDTIVVGAYENDDGAEDSGTAYVFKKTTGHWAQAARLTVKEPAYRDRFGWNVGVYGDTALIGANGDDDIGVNGGAVYEFDLNPPVVDINTNGIADVCELEQNDCNTNQIPDDCEFADSDCNDNGLIDLCETRTPFDVMKVTAEYARSRELFAASICFDGNQALVSRYNADIEPFYYEYYSWYLQGSMPFGFAPSTGPEYSGRVTLLSPVGDGWHESHRFFALPFIGSSHFGYSVSIDGDTALIGAPNATYNNYGGSVYCYQKFGSDWYPLGRVTLPVVHGHERFGHSVAHHGDTAVIGAPDDDDFGLSAGLAFIFKQGDASWVRIAQLNATDALPGDQFGSVVAISEGTVAITAPMDDGNGIDRGSAYVFREDAGTWQQLAKLAPDDGTAQDHFGSSLAMEQSTIVVGATEHAGAAPSSGAVYVYREINGYWLQVAELSASDGATGDRFGCSVAINRNVIVVGATNDDDNGSDSGSAYIFLESDGTWREIGKLTAFDGAAGNNFGVAVAIKNGTVFVGAHKNAEFGVESGAAYVFKVPVTGDCNGNGVPDECDIPGDGDGSGAIDQADLAGFVTALLNPSADCLLNGDLNGDGMIDGTDIPPFIHALLHDQHDSPMVPWEHVAGE